MGASLRAQMPKCILMLHKGGFYSKTPCKERLKKLKLFSLNSWAQKGHLSCCLKYWQLEVQPHTGSGCCRDFRLQGKTKSLQEILSAFICELTTVWASAGTEVVRKHF